VRRVLTGERAAFDALVTRHRGTVLQQAYVFLRNWEDAEDAAQQAFLQAFTRLQDLREGSKFRGWLLAITRHCALHLQRQAVDVELTDALPAPRLDDILVEYIRASLEELSARNRSVLVWHYLDGLSVREIAGRLGIPEGSVKRILHNSRNSLRALFGLPIRKGAISTMTTESTSPGRNLLWWVNGRPPHDTPLDSLLGQTVILTVNKKAMNIEQIAKRVQAHPQFVQDAINGLLREELLTKTSSGRYRTNFLALDAADRRDINARIKQVGTQVAEIIIKRLPKLEAAWNRTEWPPQGYRWAVGSWITIGLFVRKALERHATPLLPPSPPQPLRPGGFHYWIGGHEEAPDLAKPYVTGFHIWPPEPDMLAYGYFIYYASNRPRIMLSSERGRALTAVYRGVSEPEAIAHDYGLLVGQAREVLASLIESRLIKRQGEALALNFPVITPREEEILLPVLDDVTAPIGREMIGLAAVELADGLAGTGYGHLKAQFPIWAGWFRLEIESLVIREIIERGVLPPMPDPVPVEFAMIGWLNPSRLL